MYVAQGPITFHRVPHRLLNIQLVVKPNDTGEPLLSTSQQISIGDEASRRELDEEVGARPPVVTAPIGEAQLADQAAQPLV